MSRGFFTIAQGDMYVRFAYALALSLKLSQKEVSNLSIGITPGYEVPEQYKHAFDQIIEIPWGDSASESSWKLENEWKAIYMSPYDETIKLDADMLFFEDLSVWWSIMSQSDVVFTTEVRTYRNDPTVGDYYRKVFTANDLPNVYTAMFYFKKTEPAFGLFKLAEDIFNNWEAFFYDFFEAEHRPSFVSTDVVFGLVAKILDIPSINKLPHLGVPTFAHMKTQLQNWHVDENTPPIPEEWNKVIQVYFNEDCELYIGNYRQTIPVHYYLKDFLTDDMIKSMERKLEV